MQATETRRSQSCSPPNQSPWQPAADALSFFGVRGASRGMPGCVGFGGAQAVQQARAHRQHGFFPALRRRMQLREVVLAHVQARHQAFDLKVFVLRPAHPGLQGLQQGRGGGRREGG